MSVLGMNPWIDLKFDHTIGINRTVGNEDYLEKRVTGGVALKDIACLLISGFHDAFIALASIVSCFTSGPKQAVQPTLDQNRCVQRQETD